MSISDLIKTGEVSGHLNLFAQRLIPYNHLDFEIDDLTKYAELGTVSLSKEYLQDPNAPALLVHQAAKNLLTDRFINYEPESIWLDLKKLGVRVPEENKNKILMINALLSTDPVIYDVHVFKSIVLTFNDEIANPEITEETEPEQIAWSIMCLHLLRPEVPTYFDYEPILYTATILHRNGFILSPDILEFSQESLDRLNANIELKENISAALKRRNAKNSVEQEQLNKLDRVKEYVKIKYKDYTSKLEQLLSPEERGQKVAKELLQRKIEKERKTEFYKEDNVGFGSILGYEKSGSFLGKMVDTVPPVFTISVTGA